MGCQVVRVLTACIMFWRSAYLKSRYWSHPPVLHLNIRHPVKAGAHLKQKGQRLEKADLKVKSSNSPSKKEWARKMSLLVLIRYWNSSEWYIFVTRRMPRVALARTPGLHFIFFRTIYRTNEEGYDQFDHIWATPGHCSFQQHSWQNFPVLCPARASLYLMRADRMIRELAAMTQRLRTTLPREESALLQTLQYSPYFACCALFS